MYAHTGTIGLQAGEHVRISWEYSFIRDDRSYYYT
mgnify:CR=1 FL=1